MPSTIGSIRIEHASRTWSVTSCTVGLPFTGMVTSTFSVPLCTKPYFSLKPLIMFMDTEAFGYFSLKSSNIFLSTASPATSRLNWSSWLGTVPCIRTRSVVPAPMSTTSTSLVRSMP